MILGRSRILALVGGGLIENFSTDCLCGAGYDLRAGRIYELLSGSRLGVAKRCMPDVKEAVFGTYLLGPNEYVLVETVESVKMPKDLMARILPRSTIFRCGCALHTAVVDPGYRGTLTFGLKNLSQHPFTLESRARVAQIVFETVEGETVEYDGSYQGGRVT